MLYVADTKCELRRVCMQVHTVIWQVYMFVGMTSQWLSQLSRIAFRCPGISAGDGGGVGDRVRYRGLGMS